MKYFLLLTCLLSSFAFAKYPPNNDHGESVGTELIEFKQYPRVLVLSDSLKFGDDGQIYSCREPASRTNVQHKSKDTIFGSSIKFVPVCSFPKTPTVDDGWVSIDKIEIPGYEFTHYQLVQSGRYGSMSVYLYYKKVAQ